MLFEPTTECLFASTWQQKLVKTSHLDVPDLQWYRASLWTDNVIMGGPSHLSLQGLKLTINVWKLTVSNSATLHLKRHV